MSKIIPAIMPKDIPDIDDHVYDVKGVTDWVQIDIMDGKFVPAMTWPFSNDVGFLDVVDQKKTLPFWNKVEYELDMMVENPLEKVDQWIQAGISRAIIHVQSVDNLESVVNEFSERFRIPDSPVGVELMLAVPFDSDPDIILNVVDKIDGVQIMGIDPVGVQGSEFKPQTLETIKSFRAAFPYLPISVDGGVKRELLSDLFEAGIDRAVMGSAVYGVEDIRGGLREMLELV